jgi:hypothetical protein
MQRKPTKCCSYEKGGTEIGWQVRKMAGGMIPTSIHKILFFAQPPFDTI